MVFDVLMDDIILLVVYNVTSNGPSKEPWGTPKCRGFESDCVFFILTDCLQSEI